MSENREQYEGTFIDLYRIHDAIIPFRFLNVVKHFVNMTGMKHLAVHNASFSDKMQFCTLVCSSVIYVLTSLMW